MTVTVTTSVVVPVYNDPEGLETTVESLLDQRATAGGDEDDREYEYEVVIADNGSTDETAAVARRFARDRPERVRRAVEDDVQSSYAARNAGIEASAGEVVAFVDADMWVEPDYVASVTERILEGDAAYVGCDVELVADRGSVARYRRATGFPVEAYVTEDRFAPTCCLVVHRRLFDAVGPFDARLVSNGDLEFGRRAHRAGFELAYEPDVTLYHPARSTVRELASQNVRIGRGRAQVRRRHGDRLDVRSPFDPRNYLPVHPGRFRNDVGGAHESGGELLLWYALACLQKWSRTAGHLRESARDARDAHDSIGYHGSR